MESNPKVNGIVKVIFLNFGFVKTGVAHYAECERAWKLA
jgi:hypothetical protein